MNESDWIPIVAIVGGLSIAAFSMHLRMKARKLMHDERLAMIERGLVPPPLNAAELADFPSRRRASSRHVGVILVALGIGLGVLIALNGEEKNAIGVGGLMAMIGVGFLINARLDQRAASQSSDASGTTKEPPA